MHIFTNPNYNFLRWRWHAVVLSWVVIIAGLVAIYTKGVPKGIEFAGGTSVIMQFDQVPSVDAVGTAIVGPAVGEELTQKGISAFVLSLLGILAYLAFRFEFSFAVGAVIATL